MKERFTVVSGILVVVIKDNKVLNISKYAKQVIEDAINKVNFSEINF